MRFPLVIDANPRLVQSYGTALAASIEEFSLLKINPFLGHNGAARIVQLTVLYNSLLRSVP